MEPLTWHKNLNRVQRHEHWRAPNVVSRSAHAHSAQKEKAVYKVSHTLCEFISRQNVCHSSRHKPAIHIAHMATGVYRGAVGKPGIAPKPVVQARNDDDDWETDADFVVGLPATNRILNMRLQNDVSEQQQRWGAKTVVGSGHQGSVNFQDVRQTVMKVEEKVR